MRHLSLFHRLAGGAEQLLRTDDSLVADAPRVDANDGIHLGLTPTNRFFMNSKAQCMFVCMLQISALITKCIIYNNIASINYNSHKLKNLTLPKTLVTIKK